MRTTAPTLVTAAALAMASACGERDSDLAPPFSMELMIGIRAEGVSLEIAEGRIDTGPPGFLVATVEFESYERARDTPGVVVSVLRDGVELSEITAEIRDCDTISQETDLGDIVQQRQSLTVFEDGVIGYGAGCWGCDGTLLSVTWCP